NRRLEIGNRKSEIGGNWKSGKLKKIEDWEILHRARSSALLGNQLPASEHNRASSPTLGRTKPKQLMQLNRATSMARYLASERGTP
ncbi:MAG TPA: hypothetical protein VLU47_02675, partial [Blastocatellia bacterium]|nr:hypothetical protein [Blastocatellia bacterium]